MQNPMLNRVAIIWQNYKDANSNSIKKNIAANKVMRSVVIYFLISIVLKIEFSINILIPCLWKILFHFECP